MAIYLDNAATSHPKPEAVYRAVDHALRHLTNPGRGGHSLSLDASREVFEAREAVAEFFGIADAGRVAFTSGATAALNGALFGLLHPGEMGAAVGARLTGRGHRVFWAGAGRSPATSFSLPRQLCA